MKFFYTLMFLLALSVSAFADSFTSTQKQEMDDGIRHYLMTHPEVLREAIGVMAKQDKEESDKAQGTAIKKDADVLYRSSFQADVGNPTGDVTLVEFFDYNCHYCKNALPDIAKLIKETPYLHVVLKDFPVLGQASLETARVASAVRNQLPGSRFWTFHANLLSKHSSVGRSEALAVAKEMGSTSIG